MAEAAERAAQLPGAQPIHLYKNNTDNKGASYGTHENYLMKRETPFSDIVRHLTPFFVSRQVVTGAGRVGIGQDGHEHGFQISQRADYFEVEVGLETVVARCQPARHSAERRVRADPGQGHGPARRRDAARARAEAHRQRLRCT